MNAKKTVLAMTVVALMFLAGLHITVYAGEKAADYTDVVILSTTDMHGKCWNTNVLTDSPQRGSMLKVSSAVSQIREEYGEENVLLVDNGDLFQGTPVSQIQLLRYSSGESTDPPAMALCLKEIGYDAFVLGNHEFNYDWGAMSAAYRWLEDNGVPVLAANACYDGTDAEHAAGENAFTPYIIKTITVNGHEHKIGILGFENSDITRWDLPVNYPGLVFAHPGNDAFSMSYEAQLYIPRMQEEGCEFIIVSYHGGLGDTDKDLVFGLNSEDQGKRMIEECEGIDLLIIGHDHSTGYSNTFETDRSGKEVLVVNGGGQELTRSVFRFSEDEDGALVWELAETENLVIDDYETDKALEEKIRLYAELAEAVVEQPVGTAEGDWDKNSNFYTSQTDSIDLVSAAMMEIGTKRLQEKFGETGAAALKDAVGLDHLDVDMSMTSVTASGNYTICPGDISFKDIYRLYRYDNVILVLPMYGREILSVMEENAANRLAVREIWDEAYFYTHDDQFTNIVFGGLNFTYDMSKPTGERVQAEGFSNGRAFDEDGLFLVVVNNYILGNERCGLREYGEEDAIWSQLEEADGETIQDLIAEYISDQCSENGAVTPGIFTWNWSIGYSADPAALPPYEGERAASLVRRPEDGHTYVIYHEAQGCTFTERETNGGLGAVEAAAYGEILPAPLPGETLTFTMHADDAGRLMLTDPQGRYLTAGSSGGLMLTESASEGDLSVWNLVEAYGGWYVVNAGARGNQALEFYSGRFTTYELGRSGIYTFNFYEVKP